MDIKEAREIAGLSQFAVAKRTRIPRMRLSLAECGEIELRPEEVDSVRNILRKEIEQRTAILRTTLTAIEPAEAAL